MTSPAPVVPMSTAASADAPATATQPDPDLAASVQTILTSGELSQNALAGALGISPSSLSQWVRGVYRGDNGAVNVRVAAWLASREERESLAGMLPPERPWYHTATADRIWARLQLAHHAPDIAVVHGGAGVGKTVTARHYADTHPGVWLVTMSPDCGGVTAALQEISDAMGIDVPGGGAASHRRAILRRLRQADGALLIVDEAQHLSAQALDEIRTLHDRGACGIAYLGNEGVWSQLVSGGRKGIALDRLHSRIGARAECPRATKEDIAALLTAWGITDRAARALVAEIASKPGALRAATKVIRSAHLYSDGAALTVEHLRAAQRGRGL